MRQIKPTQTPIHILVIEDNIGDYLLLEEMIKESGIPIASINLAKTLQEGRDWVRTRPTDLIFLDLFLPDSRGLDSLNEVQQVAPTAPIIIMSGMSDMEVAVEAISQGAQDYLVKGEFDEKLLQKTINYSIERKKSIQSLREANERYDLVKRATHDLIWDWNLETDEMYRDADAMIEVYGLTGTQSLEKVTSWNGHLHPDDKPKLFVRLEAIKQSRDTDFFELEYRFLADDGQYRHILDRGYVVRNAEGKAVRLIGAAQDVTEQVRLRAEITQFELQQQRAITEATINGQEKERQQLGIELHDNITQILATAKLYLDYALSKPIVTKEIVMQSQQLLSMATEEIRKLSHTLLPPSQEFGLLQAMEELVSLVNIAGKFKINTDWEQFDESILLKDQQLTIYRILQEQLNNIGKHAKASQINIRLTTCHNGRDACFVIQDNGKGFDQSIKKTGIGLRNISSRVEVFGGKATIESAPGMGCTLKVEFPVQHIPTFSSIAIKKVKTA